MMIGSTESGRGYTYTGGERSYLKMACAKDVLLLSGRNYFRAYCKKASHRKLFIDWARFRRELFA